MESLDWIPALHHLNLNHLRTFMAVADLRSFRAAALQMHISQSALSVQVRQLEDTLGLALLHRTTRQVCLTAEGERLYAVLRRLGTDLVRITTRLKDEAALQCGLVTVAVLPSLASTLLPGAIRAFRVLYPGIEIRMRDVDSKQAVSLIRSGEVDTGVLSRNDNTHDLRFTLLFRDDFLAVVPANAHPLHRRRTVRLQDLAQHPLLLNPRGVDLRETLETLFRREGIVPQPAQELVGTPALVSLVRQGLGVSVQPRIALYGLDLSHCHLPKLAPSACREIGVVIPAAGIPSPATLAFHDFLCAQGARHAPYFEPGGAMPAKRGARIG